MCCSAVTQLLILGKSIISNANKALDQDVDEEMKFNWPEDSVERAMIIRAKTQLIVGLVEAVCSAFITGRVVTVFICYFLSQFANFFFFFFFFLLFLCKSSSFLVIY